MYAYPQNSFVANRDALCLVTVDVFDVACTNVATASYELTVTRDGTLAALLLTADDS